MRKKAVNYSFPFNTQDGKMGDSHYIYKHVTFKTKQQKVK